jgi:branched-chain amino acid transport system permease protein
MHLSGLIAYASMFLGTALVFGIACMGLNLQWGKTGLFNVGVAGFLGVGAYVSALLTTPVADTHAGGWGLPIVVGCVAAALASGLVSVLVGFLTLRLRTDYLAITTFGAAIVIQLLLVNATHVTGGPLGIAFIPRPYACWADRPTLFAVANLGLVALLVAAIHASLGALVDSPWGRVLRALREDETAAVSLGKSATRYRLQAFGLGGALMGLAGALQAHLVGFIAPDNFDAGVTFQIWAMLVIGGSGNNAGALLGAVVVWGIWSLTGLATTGLFPPEEQARAAALRIVAIGVLLCLVIVWRPGGLLGERLSVSRHLRRADPSRSPVETR